LGLNSGPHICYASTLPCKPYTPSPFYLIFSNRVLNFCLGLALNLSPFTSTCWVVGITDVNHHAQPHWFNLFS
jgi:hypothetical protein